jgi:hypothetical protein
VDHTKNVLWDLSQRLQNELAKDDNTRSVLMSLLTKPPFREKYGEKGEETTGFDKHLNQTDMEYELDNLTIPQFN